MDIKMWLAYVSFMALGALLKTAWDKVRKRRALLPNPPPKGLAGIDVVHETKGDSVIFHLEIPNIIVEQMRYLNMLGDTTLRVNFRKMLQFWILLQTMGIEHGSRFFIADDVGSATETKLVAAKIIEVSDFY